MRALIIVDVQPDFMPGGALAVPGGDEIIQFINKIQKDYDVVVATQDWHPPGHGSFASNHEGKGVGDIIDLHGVQQFLWPDHCIQGTAHADLAPKLYKCNINVIFRKGMDLKVDSYSAFNDNDGKNDTGLAGYLRTMGIRNVDIVGLATDYCVKFTALDAIERGFNTRLLLEGCRGVNVNPGDVETAVEFMKSRGVNIVENY